ncbi:MAG: PD-(D/E)XK nuclease domain-containing protein, partial [Anaerolineales bacterium]
IFKLIGLDIQAEVRTNQGRIDAVIETDAAIYIFEFKLDGSAAEALKQIKTKKYFAPYLLRDKVLHLAGVNFEMEKRGVGEWQVESGEQAGRS